MSSTCRLRTSTLSKKKLRWVYRPHYVRVVGLHVRTEERVFGTQGEKGSSRHQTTLETSPETSGLPKNFKVMTWWDKILPPFPCLKEPTQYEKLLPRSFLKPFVSTFVPSLIIRNIIAHKQHTCGTWSVKYTIWREVRVSLKLRS